MSTGTGLMQRVMLAIGARPGVRVFRQNVGMGWVGDAAKLKDGSILIRNPRPLHAGLVKGSGDLIGWTSREIRPEDVGTTVAVFTSIEVKDSTKAPTTEQRRWHTNVRAAGGITGVARSEEDAIALVEDGQK